MISPANEARRAAAKANWANGVYANRVTSGSRITWTPEMIVTARAMAGQGIKPQRIAERVGVHLRTYLYWLSGYQKAPPVAFEANPATPLPDAAKKAPGGNREGF